MMFKNSLKLFIANFSVFWKLLLYKIVAVVICALFLIPTFSAWSHCLGTVNFSTILTNFATNTVFLNTSSLLNNLFLLVQAFLDALIVMFNVFPFAFFYSIFVVLILLPFLFGLSSIPTGEGLYSYMASLSKSSFMATFVSKLGVSSVYSIFRTLITLPFIVIFGAGFYGLLYLTTFNGLIQIFLPIIIILYFVFMISMLVTTFCGWMPATVVFDISPSKSFKKGIKAVSRRYFRVFSSVFVIIFFATMFSMMFTSFSLIALVPLASVSIIMLEMVMFFESQGMRYYVDLDSIISPKKLEQCDKFNKVKNII